MTQQNNPTPAVGRHGSTPSVSAPSVTPNPFATPLSTTSAGFIFGAPSNGTQFFFGNTSNTTAGNQGLIFGRPTSITGTQFASSSAFALRGGDAQSRPAFNFGTASRTVHSAESKQTETSAAKPGGQQTDTPSTAESSQPDEKGGESISAMPRRKEVLDPRGDLTVVAGKERVVFRVCSRALSRSSPVWDRMLYGPFSEGKEQQAEDDWKIQLPDDNPKGLQVLFLAAHGKFAAISSVLERDTLFHVTVLCDKYDMVGFLKPFWTQWVKGLPHLQPEPENLVHQLWIAHTLGDRALYRRVLETLLRFTSQYEDSDTLFVRGYSNYDLAQDTHLQSLNVLGQ